jgi:hypothetical protein
MIALRHDSRKNRIGHSYRVKLERSRSDREVQPAELW